ncbi:MAG: GNAT family N-acetyltransferase [Saprospiraceae bacterium]|nr:GNAT family N-acetyltransferase [Saprospiraceae bacterium]
MELHLETARFILRDIRPEDLEGFYELDSDPEVHRYLGNCPVTDKEQLSKVIESIRKQYLDHGIGRWAVIEKTSGKFIGWCGLKWVTDTLNGHQNYHDLGYRIVRSSWGKGVATECASATLEYGFHEMGLKKIYAAVHLENLASQKVLENTGFRKMNAFECDSEPHWWYQLGLEDWERTH